MTTNDTKSNQPEEQSISYSRKLSTTEKAAIFVGDRIAPERKIPLDQRLKKLTEVQKSQLQEIENNAISNFSGMLDELESALGMLRIGHHMGWKVLYLVHSKKTIRKYEEILNIKIRDIFEEEGPSAKRSIGLAIAQKFSNFWKVVSGEAPLNKEEKENRRKIE